MVTHGSVAKSARERKERRPDLYCPQCLWMTGGGPCPRHGGPAWTPERQAEATRRSRGEAQPTEVQRIERGGT